MIEETYRVKCHYAPFSIIINPCAASFGYGQICVQYILAMMPRRQMSMSQHLPRYRLTYELYIPFDVYSKSSEDINSVLWYSMWLIEIIIR